ncbi:MAG: hypothetical protein KJ060_10275 [Candidatus Hydrogenedentes bacterium]|nr:hypothetical protein [Candidatus Hydrogenedentota bacterium]
MASEVDISARVQFANRTLEPDAAIANLGTTPLGYLEIPIPAWHEGKPPCSHADPIEDAGA